MADPSPALVTVPNVELLSTGTWQTSTGEFTFTKDDLTSAVAATDDPNVKLPRLKIGHLDPRFTPDDGRVAYDETIHGNIYDGTPVVGKATNLRLGKDGHTIVGDVAGVPAWLAEVMPTAWPSRSIEGAFEVTTASGRKHGFVLTALALLGDEMPAVETLQDLPVLFSADGPEGAKQAFEGRRVVASKGGTMPRKVAASTAIEDVRRAFYDQVAQGDMFWWWICAVYVDPALLIIEDDDGELWAVTYQTGGTDSDGDGDAVSFDEPVKVETQFVAEDGKVLASAGKPDHSGAAAVYASRDESRPEPTTKETPVATATEDLAALRSDLGLSDDADEAAIIQAQATRLKEAQAKPDPTPTPDPDPTPEPAPADNGIVSIDKTKLDELVSKAEQGAKAREEQLVAARKAKIEAAVKAGKFAPARREHYERLHEVDPEGTEKILASLAAGLIPVDERGGQSPDNDAHTEVEAELVRASFGLPTRKAA